MNTIQCQNCEAENLGTVDFCKQCGRRLERAAVTDPPPSNTPPPIAPPRMGTAVSPSSVRVESKFAALRGIAALCRLLAYIFAGLTALGGIAGFFGWPHRFFFYGPVPAGWLAHLGWDRLRLLAGDWRRHLGAAGY